MCHDARLLGLLHEGSLSGPGRQVARGNLDGAASLLALELLPARVDADGAGVREASPKHRLIPEPVARCEMTDQDPATSASGFGRNAPVFGADHHRSALLARRLLRQRGI